MNEVSTELLKQFSEKISTQDLLPLWDRQVKLVPGSSCVAAHWPYEMMRPLLDESTGLITKKQADRRVLVMENPALKGSSFIANSLFAGQQIILPGEIASSHRHSPNALRFVVEGEGAYTSVNGEKVSISPGDFIVTPNWTWHDHGNLGSEAVVWMDGLDTPFTSLFGAHFRENYPQDIYPVTHSPDFSRHQYGSNLLPLEYGLDDQSTAPSLLIYPFKKTREALLHLAAGAPDQMHPVHGFKLRYSNPATGAYPFKTMAAFMQYLPQGFIGKGYRSTENTVFNVAQGACTVLINHHEWHLKTHDVLVIPSWETYELRCSQDAMLFSFSDRAAQQALGFWREETV